MSQAEIPSNTTEVDTDLGWPYSARIDLKDLEPGMIAEDMSGNYVIRLTERLSDAFASTPEYDPPSFPVDWPRIPPPPPGWFYVCNIYTGEIYFQPANWSYDPLPEARISIAILKPSK